ncbi:hypothetical protein IFR05_008325 [Cadophora sp. M221]|nr:hypothetical protein IFR05_008325 [Cadophora sp. M221]
MPKYTYAPLDHEQEETRFLRLLPGSFSDEVKIHIFHAYCFKNDSDVAKSESSPIGTSNVATEHDMARDRPVIHLGIAEHGQSLSADTESICCGDHGITSSRPTGKAEIVDGGNALHPPFDGIYEALSYTWGSSENPQNIAVVKMLTEEAQDLSLEAPFTREDTLSISQNLHDALKHLRRPHEARILWIDAICIDQSDEKERSREVSRMGDIYRRARQVVIWLGPEADDSQLAMELIKSIGSDLVIENSRFKAVRYRNPDIQRRWETDAKKRHWNAFLKLLSRPWFTRLWVFQETQLAVGGVVVAGLEEAVLRHFVFAVSRLDVVHFNDKVKAPIPSEPIRISNIMDLLWPVRQHSSPSILIETTRSLSCLDPRDRVYGILSLLPYNFDYTQRPDYTLNVEDVYKEFFLAQLSSYSVARFDQVIGNGCSSFSTITVPSWVPDLAWHGSAFPTSSAGSSSHEITHSKMDDSLTIPGVQIDKVRYVGEAIPSTATMDEMLKIVRSWERSLTNNIYRQDESRIREDLHITIDKFITAITSRIHEAVSQGSTPRETWLHKRRVEYAACMNSGGRRSYSTHLLHNMYYCLPGRTFFITENGMMGLGPASMLGGDFVCFGLGCLNLLILHPLGKRGCYTIRGDACIPGLMFGEGLLGPVVQKVEVFHDKVNGTTYNFTINVYTVGDKHTQVDPRLGPLPAPWRIVFQFGGITQEGEFNNEGKRGLLKFQNIENEKIQQADPRLTSAGLRGMGINVQDFVVM